MAAYRRIFIPVLLALLNLIAPRPANSCSTFFVSNSPDAVVAKNLDWFSGQGIVLINKRHVAKNSVLVPLQTTPLSWVSKYGSLTFTGSGSGFPWEGMNEAGLSVNSLQLQSSLGPAVSSSMPTTGYIQWIQYILDTSATVAEAIQRARAVHVSPSTKLHYFVCDATSACAVFEYLAGLLVIHAADELPVKALTNNDYAESVDWFHNLSESMAPEAILHDLNSESLHRFSRAALWSQNFQPQTESVTDHAFNGLYNLTQVVPSTPNFQGWRTFWSIVFGLKAGTASWRTLDSFNVKSVKLSAFDLNCASGAKILDVNVRATGDVTTQFVDYTPAANQRSVDAWAALPEADIENLPATALAAIRGYPEAQTRCLE